MAQDRYVAQWAYITPKQLVHMTPERIVQLYQVFNDDMPGNLRELQNEVDHWKAILEMVNVAEKPDTLDANMYTAVIVLMVMSVSTATANRPYSAMLHLKNYQRSTMTTERMLGLALMHVHKDTELDAERIIHQFSRHF